MKTVSFIGGPNNGRLIAVEDDVVEIKELELQHVPLNGLDRAYVDQRVPMISKRIVLRIHSFEGTHWVIDKRPTRSEPT